MAAIPVASLLRPSPTHAPPCRREPGFAQRPDDIVPAEPIPQRRLDGSTGRVAADVFVNGRPIPTALAAAVRLLEARGFALVARNERGDSLYLRPADCPWHLRLSNHARTAKQRARRSDILTSLVIDGPRSPERVEALVEDASRNFRAALARKIDQASAAGSRK